MIPKFKAWDKKYKKIMKVNQIDFEKRTVWIEADNGDHENRHTLTREFGDIELMQSTGLKDKNGVEIFEGDFCIQRGEEPYSDENMTLDEDWEYRGVIKFQDFAYWIQDNDGFVKWLGTDCDEIEAIGNVWEDGDLINDGKRTKEN